MSILRRPISPRKKIFISTPLFFCQTLSTYFCAGPQDAVQEMAERSNVTDSVSGGLVLGILWKNRWPKKSNGKNEIECPIPHTLSKVAQLTSTISDIVKIFQHG